MSQGIERCGVCVDKRLLEKIEYIAEYDGRSTEKELEIMMVEWIRAFEEVCGEINPKAPSDEGAVSRKAD